MGGHLTIDKNVGQWSITPVSALYQAVAWFFFFFNEKCRCFKSGKRKKTTVKRLWPANFVELLLKDK